MSTAEATVSRPNQLYQRQLELLYEQAPAALAGSVAVMLFAAFTLYGRVPGPVLGNWLGITALLYALRMAGILVFRSVPEERRARRYWELWYSLGALATGAAWGYAGMFLMPHDTAVLPALMVVVIGGLGAATSVTYAAVRYASPAFILTSMLPLAFGFVMEGGGTGLTIGVLISVFAVVLVLTSRHAYSATLHALELGLSNLELLEEAEQAGYQARALNEELKAEIAERRQMEESLRISQSRFADAQRIAGFGNWDWFISTDQIIWSAEVYRIFGIDAAHGDISYERYVAAVHPGDRQRVQLAVQEALQGHRQFAMDYRILRTDGAERVVHDEGEVVCDEQGHPVSMRGVVRDITRRYLAEEKIRISEQELSRILSNMQDTFYRTDLEGRIIRISPSAESLVQWRPEQLIGRRMADFYVEADGRARFVAALDAGNGEVRNFEAALRRKDGSVVWVATNAQYYRDELGAVCGVEGTTRDITELKRAEEALYREKEQALVTLQSIGDGVVTTDTRGVINYLNPVAERLLGVELNQARGRDYLELLRLRDEGTGEALDDLVRICLSRDGAMVQADDGILSHADGKEYTINVTAAPMRSSVGEVMGVVLVLHDITEVMGMARQLSYQATHDMLTGLVNRREFETRLDGALRGARGGAGPHALFYIDLDQFKVVNDTCGHVAGDELLEQLAGLLRDRIRESDTLARLGGDEFGVLLQNCPLARASAIADELRQVVKEFRFVWKDKSFEIGASIGVVPISAESGNRADVLSAADAACYVAKDLGRNRIHVYESEDGEVAIRHGEMQWVHRISHAFENDRFTLFCQPMVPLRDMPGTRAHFEVLMRMKDDNGGVVPPMAFIPAAERYNLMPTLDRWVVRTTLGSMREAQGPAQEPPIACAINLSGQSLNDDHFLDFVIEQFEETGLPFPSVCFEITETAAIANLTRAMRFIAVLRGLGCSFALDDFGSGLSSFGYLKSLSVDYLKIDGSFVKDLVDDSVDRAMVEAINQVGHVMGLKTIAEFVENDAIMDELRRIGVDFGQGYGIAAPQPLDDVLAALGRQRGAGLEMGSQQG